MITVIVPTNRYDCVKEIIEGCISDYKGCLFRFEIHDSSKDDRIGRLIANLGAKAKSRISYFKYPISISADEKAIQAIRNVSSEYFWLMGDGVIADFNGMEGNLGEIENYLLIDVESVNRIGHLGQDKSCICEKIYGYSDLRLYAKKYFSHLTYWGASIIRTDFYQKAYDDIIRKYQMKQIPWWISCSLFDLLADCLQNNGDKIVGVIYTTYVTSNPRKKDHWWSTNECYYEYTFTKFNQGISLLSAFYDQSLRKEIIYNFRNDALVTNYYLIHLRAINNLSKEMLRKYKNDIEIVSGFYGKMYLYLFMPQGVALVLEWLCNVIKPLYLKFRRHELLVRKALLKGC